VREGEGACALHEGRQAVGACGRCGNYFCQVCRTRWRDQILCAACIDRTLAAREATPEQARTHFRQALFGLLMGLSAWMIFILGILVVGVAAVANNITFLPIVFLLVLLLFMSAMLLGVLGTGLAVAALRTRGQHMIMATSALLIGGLFLGVFLGNYILELWIM
jgi:hypothetical protein